MEVTKYWSDNILVGQNSRNELQLYMVFKNKLKGLNKPNIVLKNILFENKYFINFYPFVE